MSKRVTTATFQKMKKDKEKITILTAYDYPMATIVDESGVDAILVGDSLGMVVLGYEDTTQVTMEDMVHHIKAVSRGTKRALVIGDMPFLSYHISISQSVINAGRILQEGKAQAVKLEGGKEIIDHVRAIVNAGIPVMGHLGLTPQSIHKMGGYFIQGKTSEQAEALLEDAKALEEAGVFAVVLECVTEEVATFISENLTIPTIGIGAGRYCDGQVLVMHDVLGLYKGNSPKFSKCYYNMQEHMAEAISDYVKEVKTGVFPSEAHVFYAKNESINKLYGKGDQA
jgi:3-methyl-2-oxobutanoate hydroxymethyltransferase